MAKRKHRPTPAVSPEAIQQFGPRLAAIGQYRLSIGADGTDIEWGQPTALPDLGFRLRAVFSIDTDVGHLDPDEPMFALWDQFTAGIDQHAAHFRRTMVSVYRENQPYFIEQDEFPPDLTDAEILKLLLGTITVKRHEVDGEVNYWLDVSFAARWDGEHAWDFEYDQTTNSFGESSKG